MRNVDQPGSWRERRRLPVLCAGRRRTQVAHDFARHRLLFRHVLQKAGLEIHAAAGSDRRKRTGRQDFPAGPINHVHIPISIRVDQNLACLSFDREVEQNILVDRIVVVEIVRAKLIKPDRLPGIGIARENPGREFVVAGPSFRIPRTRVRRPVINQVQLWIVRDPSPNTRATDLPGIRRPTLHAKILPAILGIEWLEFRSDQNIFVGPGAVSAPCDPPGFFIESGEPAANAEFPAAVPN